MHEPFYRSICFSPTLTLFFPHPHPHEVFFKINNHHCIQINLRKTFWFLTWLFVQVITVTVFILCKARLARGGCRYLTRKICKEINETMGGIWIQTTNGHTMLYLFIRYRFYKTNKTKATDTTCIMTAKVFNLCFFWKFSPSHTNTCLLPNSTVCLSFSHIFKKLQKVRCLFDRLFVCVSVCYVLFSFIFLLVCLYLISVSQVYQIM